jgi:hypothetical protein
MKLFKERQRKKEKKKMKDKYILGKFTKKIDQGEKAMS